MKNLRLILLIPIWGILFVGLAFAQGGPKHTPAERAQHITDHMSEKLGLSADQKVKVLAINKKYAEQRAQVKQNADANKREEMWETVKEQDAEIKAVLTPEQLKKYEELKAKKMEHRENKKRGRH